MNHSRLGFFFFPSGDSNNNKSRYLVLLRLGIRKRVLTGFFNLFSVNCFRVVLNRVGKYPIRDSISLTLADWSTKVQHASGPPQWRTADAEIRIPPVENPELKVLPFKPGVGPNIALHATPTARDFFLGNFCPSGPFTCIFFFPKLLLSFFLC